MGPHFVSGDQPGQVHQDLAGTLDAILDRIAAIQHEARTSGRPPRRPAWPMIVLRTPKGWTGPKMVDGHRAEGSWRSHQVPLAEVEDQPRPSAPAGGVAAQLPARGALRPRRPAAAPAWPPWRPRGSAAWAPTPTPTAACCCGTCACPTSADYGVEVAEPGVTTGEATRVLGSSSAMSWPPTATRANFRVFGPDETASNRLDALFEVTGRTWMAETQPTTTSI